MLITRQNEDKTIKERYSKLNAGDVFEYLGVVCIKTIDNGVSIDLKNGNKLSFTKDTLVNPIEIVTNMVYRLKDRGDL